MHNLDRCNGLGWQDEVDAGDAGLELIQGCCADDARSDEGAAVALASAICA